VTSSSDPDLGKSAVGTGSADHSADDSGDDSVDARQGTIAAGGDAAGAPGDDSAGAPADHSGEDSGDDSAKAPAAHSGDDSADAGRGTSAAGGDAAGDSGDDSGDAGRGTGVAGTDSGDDSGDAGRGTSGVGGDAADDSGDAGRGIGVAGTDSGEDSGDDSGDAGRGIGGGAGTDSAHDSGDDSGDAEGWTSAAGTDSAAADRAWADLLRQIIELSTEERNLRRVLRRVAEFVVATTRADVCFVHVVDTAAHEIVLMGATPEPFDQLAGTIRLAFGEGVAGWVAQHAKPAVVRDKWSDPRYVYIPALKGEQFNSMISLPLLRPEGVVGVLNVHSRKADHFQPGDVARLGEVASVLAGIVENAVLYDRLATREAEVARFAAQTIEMQELDRRRIAANIHDGISQRLVSAWYHLRAARDLLVADGATAGGPPVVVEIETTLALLSDALDEARNAIVGLRPAILDDLGLTAGLTSLATSLGCDAEIELDLQSVTLPAHVETALYRISQEALQNVMKHAQAQQVRIGLHESADGRVTLSVSDDGVGFEPSQAAGAMSYGMAGMQERATLIGAHLEVRSRRGDGSTIIVTLPGPTVTPGQPSAPPR